MKSSDEPVLKHPSYGGGLVKGLGITLRHLFSRSVTVQYPDELAAPPARSRGVIALKEENCTVCMLCARECPDWCIYIEGHKEAREASQPGKRAKKHNVLDRFAIDYALCMYCGICVEVCPYDALFWSPSFEYADYDVTNLTHEKERLSDWMYTVMPPPPLDEGALGPALQPAEPAAPPAAPAAAATTPAAPAPAPAASPSPAPAVSQGEDPAAVRKRVFDEEIAKGSDPRVAEARAKSAEMRAKKGAAAPAPKAPAPAAQAPPAAPEPPAPAAGPAEDPAAVRKRVFDEEVAKGSDPRVAEARAKSAEMRAKKGAAAPAPKAAAQEAAKQAAGAPAPPAPSEPVEPGDYAAFTPEEAAAVSAKILSEELAKGTDRKVAEALARGAEIRAVQGFRRPDW